MQTNHKATTKGHRWYLAFLISWIGILVIPFYNNVEPKLGGFPMFYWYQLALVVLSAVITWIVHVATRRAFDAQAEDVL